MAKKYEKENKNLVVIGIIVFLLGLILGSFNIYTNLKNYGDKKNKYTTEYKYNLEQNIDSITKEIEIIEQNQSNLSSKKETLQKENNTILNRDGKTKEYYTNLEKINNYNKEIEDLDNQKFSKITAKNKYKQDLISANEFLDQDTNNPCLFKNILGGIIVIFITVIISNIILYYAFKVTEEEILFETPQEIPEPILNEPKLEEPLNDNVVELEKVGPEKIIKEEQAPKKPTNTNTSRPKKG
jgi:ABC-type transport system involved in multi-copper enzyme maturation permease subunit